MFDGFVNNGAEGRRAIGGPEGLLLPRTHKILLIHASWHHSKVIIISTFQQGAFLRNLRSNLANLIEDQLQLILPLVFFSLTLQPAVPTILVQLRLKFGSGQRIRRLVDVRVEELVDFGCVGRRDAEDGLGEAL